VGEFVKVAQVKDIPDPGKALLEIDEHLVVLMHVGGQFYCLDDLCTHDGGPLGEGDLDDHAIACPRHGARFAIRTGAALTMPATEATKSHNVKIENGEVWVQLRD
jgi:3-phenylpropionate/trans-cinnamate dioxygenase ferredoxin component